MFKGEILEKGLGQLYIYIGIVILTFTLKRYGRKKYR